MDSTNRYAGSLLAIMSAAGFAIMDGATQVAVRRGISAEQTVFFRMVITALNLPLYIYHTDRKRFSLILPFHPSLNPLGQTPSIPALIWVRSFTESIGLCLAMASLQYLPLSEVITLFNIRPLPTALLCWVFLREPFGWRSSLASVVSLFAVILIVKPAFLFASERNVAINRSKGFVMTFVNIMTSSTGMLIIRLLGEHADELILPFAIALAGTLTSCVTMIIRQSRLSSLDDPIGWLLILIITTTGFGGQVAAVKALHRLSGGTVVVFAFFQIPFGVLFQLGLGDPLSWTDITGMSIIVAAGVFVAVSASQNTAYRKLDRGEDKDQKIQEDEYAMLPSTEADIAQIQSQSG